MIEPARRGELEREIRPMDMVCPQMGRPGSKSPNYWQSQCVARQKQRVCKCPVGRKVLEAAEKAATEREAAAREAKERAMRTFEPVAEVVETAPERAVETVKVEERKETGMAKNKNHGLCAECKREMPMVARGLCGKCYYNLKRAGKLDSLYPAQKARGPSNKSPAPPVEANPPVIFDEDLGREGERAVSAEGSFEEAKVVLSFPSDGRTPFESDLNAVLDTIAAGLIQKNLAYGDSALNPVRVFSKADPLEQINVRLDDKLSRLMRGEDAGEDTEADLLGYLILKRVAMRRLSR